MATKITITDPALIAALENATVPVEFRDPTGRLIVAYEEYRCELPPGVASPFSESQMAELRKQKTGRPTAEVLADLGKQKLDMKSPFTVGRTRSPLGP